MYIYIFGIYYAIYIYTYVDTEYKQQIIGIV